MNLEDMERACKLAELAGTGIVLKSDELRWLLDTQACLRELNAELLEACEEARDFAEALVVCPLTSGCPQCNHYRGLATRLNDAIAKVKEQP